MVAAGRNDGASKPGRPIGSRRTFKLLVLYRWLSLTPALIALLATWPNIQSQAIAVILAAIAANLLITLFSDPLNTLLRSRPRILIADLIFAAGLAALSGGWSTPYYLYALSPLLAAAFFFQLRGALLAATGMSLLFTLAGLSSFSEPSDLQLLATELIGFFLIAGTFGYATSLTQNLRRSHTNLDQAHRDLRVIHGLTLSLQSAADAFEVEERVLEAVTHELGYERAVVALADEDNMVLTAWLARARDRRQLLDNGLPHPAQVPITSQGGPVAQAVLDGGVRLNVREFWTSDAYLNDRLTMKVCHIFPLQLREHPVGVLVVEASKGERDGARIESLKSVASQAAVAVGTTMLCIDRAKRLAVQDERIRIAGEIHDTVSQSLFGIRYTLDACMQMLPEQPEQVTVELSRLIDLAESARGQLRRSILDIWPSEITAESFASDLRTYTSEHCGAMDLEMQIDVRGEFERLPSITRRGLYRIAQETINNITRHAAASAASICLEVNGTEAVLGVRDNGRGFDLETAIARKRNREHFGLRGIQDRVGALGGTVEFLSRPKAGTSVLVTVPFLPSPI